MRKEAITNSSKEPKMEPFSFAEWANSSSSLITGALGSATSAYFTQLKTWRERVLTFLAGLGAVYAFTDAISQFIKLDEKATGYLIGFFALNLCAAILKGVRRFGDDADFWTLFRELVSRFMDRVSPGEKQDKKE